ncbi:hypothetical protein CPB85DRAFT_1252463 [Mucidula mucida]|nr:hypothetical protein CPB85DRAFT_1252463 [Mucidula mucida]
MTVEVRSRLFALLARIVGGHLADINEISEEYNGPIVASQESEPDAGSFDPTRDAYEILEYASDGSQAGDRTNEDFLRAMHSNDVTDERYSPSDYGEGSQFEEDFMYAMRCEPDKKFNGDSTYLSDDGSVDNLRFREFNTTDSISNVSMLCLNVRILSQFKQSNLKKFKHNLEKKKPLLNNEMYKNIIYEEEDAEAYEQVSVLPLIRREHA